VSVVCIATNIGDILETWDTDLTKAILELFAVFGSWGITKNIILLIMLFNKLNMALRAIWQFTYWAVQARMVYGPKRSWDIMT